MKRSLVVFSFLFGSIGLLVAAPTGRVFTEYKGAVINDDGSVNYKFSSGNTGVELNFDGFGMKYLFGDSVGVGGVSLDTPGYLEVNGIKVATGVNIGMGVKPFIGYGRSSNVISNNLSLERYQMGYGIEIYPLFAYVKGDLNASTKDQSSFKYFYGHSYLKIPSVDLQIKEERWTVQPGINVKIGDNEIGGKVKFDSAWNWMSYVKAGSSFNIEGDIWGNYDFKISSEMLFDFKGWVGFRYYTSSNYVAGGDHKGDMRSVLMCGPEVRVVYALLGGAVKLNMGVGVVIGTELSDLTYNYASKQTNTNDTHLTVLLLGVRRDDDRALMEFGGSVKFGDFKAGVTARLGAALPLFYTKPVNKNSVSTAWIEEKWATSEGLNVDGGSWNEEGYFRVVLKDAYLQYSKGFAGIKFKVSGLGTAKDGGWFSAIEMEYKF